MLVDDNAEICQAVEAAGFKTYPIRGGNKERHRWSEKAFDDVPAAAEAIGAFLVEKKRLRAAAHGEDLRLSRTPGGVLM